MLHRLALDSDLVQDQASCERFSTYASHILTKVERKWFTYDIKLYGISCAVREFRHCLAFIPFVIVTHYKRFSGLREIREEYDRTGSRARLELALFYWIIH